jgi:hypothetical protein
MLSNLSTNLVPHETARQLWTAPIVRCDGPERTNFRPIHVFDAFCFFFFLSLNAKCMVSWNSHHFHTGWSSKHTRHDLGVSTCVACPACGCVSDQAQLQWQNPCQHQTTLVDCEQVNYNQPNASCFFMRCFGRFQEKV